ncbi:MAG: DUF3658 domain-containing protein [Polyangiaceae bacterium]
MQPTDSSHLLLDNDAVLPSVPDASEAALTASLDEEELHAIDQRLLAETRKSWLKYPRIVANALGAGNYDIWQPGVAELHTRRLIQLIDAGKLKLQGNPLRPRLSEVRTLELR